MLIEEIKNIKSDTINLRKFGITIIIILLLFGIFFLWKRNDIYIYFLIFSAIFVLICLIEPVILKPLQKVWMSLAIITGYFISRIILSIFFYFVFTSIALILKFLRRDLLDLKLKDKDSYWIIKYKKDSDNTCYERQY